MIWPWKRARIRATAYLPEHLPDYVLAVMGGEADLMNGHLCYSRGGTLVLVGYPLDGRFDSAALASVVERALRYYRPSLLSLIAPVIPPLDLAETGRGSDRYYRLELDRLRIGQKTRNMIQGATRSLSVSADRVLGAEHRALIDSFLDRTRADDAVRRIYGGMPRYVERSKSSMVLSARDGRGRLIAFDVADFGSGEYAFYMFNIRSREGGVPGASDLLLHELVLRAKDAGKRYVNLGLGINDGIVFFKEKWGGAPFVGYEHRLYDLGGGSVIERLFFR